MTDLFNETHCPHCNRPYEVSAPGFAQFWEKVPHKVGKPNAEKAWKKLSGADRQQADACVRTFYRLFAQQNPQASTIHPATYLNGKRWTDEGIQPDADKGSAVDAIRKGLQSNIPAVREHAQRMAERHGIGGDA